MMDVLMIAILYEEICSTLKKTFYLLNLFHFERQWYNVLVQKKNRRMKSKWI